MQGQEKNKFAIFQFPSRRKTIEVIHDWSNELSSMSVIFPKLISGGITPTGPAIRDAMYQFSKMQLKGSII